MSDLIDRQAAIDALHMHLMYRMGTDSNKKRLDDWINGVPSVQPEPSTEIQEILDYLDTTLHPIVSPDNWYVYAELHDMISRLPSVQPDNSCDGCKYEDVDDGVLVPCGYCGRSHPDNYERRTDETD